MMELVMRKFVPFVAAALLSTAAVACKNPTADVAPATVGDAPAEVAPAPTPAAEAPATQTIVLNSENTSIQWLGAKVTGTHEGGFRNVTGEMTVAGAPESVRGHIDIDVKSLFSDSDQLTAHLLNDDFFASDTHPSAKFVVTNIGNEIGEDGTRTVTGNLTLRGVEKSISFPATVAVTDSKVELNATFKINRKDFGIVYEGKADDLIRDDVALTIKVDAARPN